MRDPWKFAKSKKLGTHRFLLLRMGKVTAHGLNSAHLDAGWMELPDVVNNAFVHLSKTKAIVIRAIF